MNVLAFWSGTRRIQCTPSSARPCLTKFKVLLWDQGGFDSLQGSTRPLPAAKKPLRPAMPQIRRPRACAAILSAKPKSRSGHSTAPRPACGTPLVHRLAIAQVPPRVRRPMKNKPLHWRLMRLNARAKGVRIVLPWCPPIKHRIHQNRNEWSALPACRSNENAGHY